MTVNGPVVMGLTRSLVLTSCVLLAAMAVRGHAIGGEVWGLVAAVLALGASLATWSALRSGRRGDRLATAVLWMVVAALGIAGTLDHAAPVLPEYLDQRARPALVPLVYALLGAIGIGLLVGRGWLTNGARERGVA